MTAPYSGAVRARLDSPRGSAIRLLGIWLVGLLLAWVPPSAFAQDGTDIDEIRDSLKSSFGANRFGAGYAAIVNFSVIPEISTASYTADDPESNDPELDVHRIPARWVFDEGSNGWRPFVQANLTWQEISANLDILPGETIRSQWTAKGGSLSAGVEIPLTDTLTLLPQIDAGVVWLENDARYSGVLGNAVLQPVLENIAFDWDADAWLVGASLALDFERSFEPLTLRVHSSVTHNRIETWDASSEVVEFSGHATTLDVDLEVVHPLGGSLGPYPLSLVGLAGGTTFVGSARGELGFDHFFELGAALEADISARGGKLRRLGLGARLIFGADVTGWGLVMRYIF